jgi:hypothetical protein
MQSDRITLPAKVQRTFDHIAAQGREPAVIGMQAGCYVIALTRRLSQFDATRVYCAPGGSWTHNPDRCAQLAQRFPEADDAR